MSRSSTRAAIQVSPPPPELERIPLVENQRGPGWITDKVAGIVEGKTPAWWWWAFIPSVVLMSLLLAMGPGWNAADPLFAIGIGGWLLVNAWQIMRGSLGGPAGTGGRRRG